MQRIIKIIAVGLSLFQLYTAIFGIFRSPMAQRATHLGLVLCIFFLMQAYKGKGVAPKIFNHVLCILSVICFAFLVVDDKRLIELIRLGEPNQLEYVIGAIVVLLALEALRRTQLVICILSVLGIVYMYVGNHIPGVFSHAGMSWERIIYFQGLSTEGVLGDMMNVSSSFLFLFLLFSAFLMSSGVAKYFVDLGAFFVGRMVGGAAKLALLGSGMVGTVMGSGLANTLTTGVFTIPMMKKTGLHPNIAGAVEAIAADGGQIIPPVMGTAVFLMAEITGIPYAEIAIRAIIASVLYYVAAYVSVHLYCLKTGIRGLSEEEIPTKKSIFLNVHLLLPLLTLLLTIFIFRFTPSMAALCAIAAAIIATFFKKENRMTLKKLFESLEKGAKTAVEIAVLLAGIGIFVCSLTTTGLAMRFSTIMMDFSGGSLFLTLFIAMVTCIVLGMGLPTPAAYMVAAAFIAPTLHMIGVPILAAHLFLIHFAVKSSITPPVCTSAMVAASIAEGDWFKTGIAACVIALNSFLIPFVFVYSPGILGYGSISVAVFQIFTALVGVVSIAIGVQGFLFRKMSYLARILIIGGGLLAVTPGYTTSLTGIALVALIMIFEKWLKGKFEKKGGIQGTAT